MNRTGRPEDRYAFRTPALRNVAWTPPYFAEHTHLTLEDAVRHHLDPRTAARSWTPEQVPWPRSGSGQIDISEYHPSEAYFEALFSTLDPDVSEPVSLTDTEFQELMAFLAALSDPDFLTRFPDDLPDGLPGGRPYVY